MYIHKYSVLLDHIWNSCVEFHLFYDSSILAGSETSQLNFDATTNTTILTNLKFKH